MANEQHIRRAYELAAERYAALGVSTNDALNSLRNTSISLPCWQGDDVGGFEGEQTALGGGLAVTGTYPGKARTADELRHDFEKALSLIPGAHRLNLHASYLETGGCKVGRNEIGVEHFARWIDWCKSIGIGLDFNPTCFAHPLAADGFTLAHPKTSVRQFWIEHCKATRHIAEHIGKELKTACINNVWIPDGYKDTPFDRLAPRQRLTESLDAIFGEVLDEKYVLDAVESKLFGIGSESYVVGSHEFYLGYAGSRRKLLCLDTGHFHPTESVSDKLSAVLFYVPGVLMHLSRGVRWDSDHVVTVGDELLAIMQQIVRGKFLERVRIGLDYFDASINRVAAWVIGTRSALKALLLALLEPSEILRQLEDDGDYTGRLAMFESLRTLPAGVAWDYYCLQQNVPLDDQWMTAIKQYERSVLFARG